MKKKMFTLLFLSFLGSFGLVFSCENSNSGKLDHEILALAQTPTSDPYLNQFANGQNYIMNAERDNSNARSFVVQFINWDTLSSCTGSMITEHWVLTAAHCVSGLNSRSVWIVYTDTSGSNIAVHDAGADFYVHPEYTGGGRPKKDLALVYLKGAIYDILGFPRKVQFFTDQRVPWNDRSQQNSFTFTGYGFGSDPSLKGHTCTTEEENLGIKRFATGELFLSSVGDGMIKGRENANAKACPGDSGAPFMFLRDIGAENFSLVFAVYYGIRNSDHAMIGNLIGDRELTWIFHTINGNSTYPITKMLWDAYWKRTSFHEQPIYLTEIRNANGKCLDVEGARTDPGARVQIYTCNGTVAQQWSLLPNDVIYYREGLCLDMGSGEAGTPFTVQPCNDSVSQKLAVHKNGAITGPRTEAAERCLSILDGSSTDRTPVGFFNCIGWPFQIWSWRTN
ncbi:hypothetical protein CH373_00390 [Leptospira perolatii]|uniref:Peptidase S1 domain-containing protein n=1 Tax=Leptospira perolatii TaxID=2023191 RepID=A0A2M9ZRG6_9LEPT|nr:ricin-type beta-trefoil lectin domain protein [Leptospira perolatii]PJZ71027.1 hypothetical protein CH360_00390 [Leptospira perolatii]PJZ74559.1 hypothetical protein CH373_00390 [Leptospira perolatii]